MPDGGDLRRGNRRLQPDSDWRELEWRGFVWRNGRGFVVQC